MTLLANAHWRPAPKAHSVAPPQCAIGVALTARGRHRRAIPRGLFLPVVLPRRSPPRDAADDPSILATITAHLPFIHRRAMVCSGAGLGLVTRAGVSCS